MSDLHPVPAVVLLAALAGVPLGCQPRPEDAPETHEPGPVRAVDAGALPGASASAAGGQAPHVVPIRDWIRPAIPLIEPPEVISIWFFPRKSLDGLAYREGFWCHRVIRTFSWGKERAMIEGGVDLNGQNAHDRLRATTGEQVGLEAQPWFIDALASATAVPYTEAVLESAGQPATMPPTLRQPGQGQPGQGQRPGGTPAAPGAVGGGR
jgi:hypothetical protein